MRHGVSRHREKDRRRRARDDPATRAQDRDVVAKPEDLLDEVADEEDGDALRLEAAE